MLQATEIKVIAIFTLTVIAFLFGLLPLCLFSRSLSWDSKHHARLERFVGWLNAFAGGVFMGVALIHLLPKARQLLMEAFEIQGSAYHFNWAELIALCGFLLIVFVEQIFYIWEERLGDGGDAEASEVVAFADKEVKESDKSYRNEENAKFQSNVARHEEPISATSVSLKPGKHSTSTADGTAEDNPLTVPPIPARVKTLRAVILLISLSIHSIFEGLAIGLQLERKDVIDIFIAIGLHKGIEAFTISVRFAQTCASNATKTVYCAVFALMSPLGIIVGIPIAFSTRSQSEAGSGSSMMANAVLQGLAAGTVMFVTFIGILPHELESKKDGLLKLAFIIIGLAAISALNALEHEM